MSRPFEQKPEESEERLFKFSPLSRKKDDEEEEPMMEGRHSRRSSAGSVQRVSRSSVVRRTAEPPKKSEPKRDLSISSINNVSTTLFAEAQRKDAAV